MYSCVVDNIRVRTYIRHSESTSPPIIHYNRQSIPHGIGAYGKNDIHTLWRKYMQYIVYAIIAATINIYKLCKTEQSRQHETLR